MGGVAAVAHVLLAEFDIEEGSKVSFQYPTPTGTEAKYRPQRQPWTAVTVLGLIYKRTPSGSPARALRSVLAELMLPDGAHNRDQDWTVFFLNQTAPAAVRAHPPPHPQPIDAEGGVCGGWRGSSPSGHRPSSQRPPAPQQQCRLALHVHTPPRPP